MGVSSFCCLKQLPPTPSRDDNSSAPSLPTRTTNLAPRKGDESSPWRTKYMVGLACSMVIGVEFGNFVGNNIHGGGYSMASELGKDAQIMFHNNLDIDNKMRVAKWSERRICSPWRLNSLETIVPENLPRPSAYRRSETVSYSSQLAPSVKSPVKSSTSCFSL